MAEQSFGGNADQATYNPDRVSVERKIIKVPETVEPENRFTDVTSERTVIDEYPSAALRFFRPDDARVRAVALSAMAASVIGTVASDFGSEREFGNPNEKTAKSTVVKGALETTDMRTVVNQTQEELCHVIDADFMHRFVTKDENGQETINPGALIMPLAVGLKENCKARIDVEIHIPYHFARTFSEIAVKNPKMRNEMIAKLAAFIAEEAQNQLVIKGMAGVTDTTYVYNRAHNILVAGKPVIDLGKFNVQNLTIEGVASTEAERTAVHPDADSLQGFNPENVELAGKRLEDARPLIVEALEKTGVGKGVLQHAQNFRYEHNLTTEEITRLAAISADVLGGTIAGSDADNAYAMIRLINEGNPAVLKAIEQNEDYVKALDETIFSKRGVNISFEARTEYEKTSVYNVAVPIALALFLLPGVRFERSEGRTRVVWETVRVRNPDVETVKEVEVVTPVARRLFSEVTPEHLDEGRSFDVVYDDVDLSDRSYDTRALLQHMLLEEVLPSLDEDMKEPLIDYEDVVNAVREFLSSDARKDGVKKGEYPTPDEAMRKMTEKLLEMWERHDAATYPMEGIDLKTVLNYRHSEKIVYWAKTLSELFTKLATETTTRDEFRTQLMDHIREAAQARAARGNTARNAFVRSDFPQDEGRA